MIAVSGFVTGALLALCAEPADREFLGCSDDGVCAYCDDGIIEVHGATYDSPFVLCEDWCNTASIAHEIDGCRRLANE